MGMRDNDDPGYDPNGALGYAALHKLEGEVKKAFEYLSFLGNEDDTIDVRAFAAARYITTLMAARDAASKKRFDLNVKTIESMRVRTAMLIHEAQRVGIRNAMEIVEQSLASEHLLHSSSTLRARLRALYDKAEHETLKPRIRAVRAAAKLVELDKRLERSWFHTSALRKRLPDVDRMDAKLKRRERGFRLFLYLHGVGRLAQGVAE